MMALKMLYRGPSARLNSLIEKIQATKELNAGMYSTHTTSSYSPSISDGTATPSSLQNYCHLSQYQQQQQLQVDEEQVQRCKINGINPEQKQANEEGANSKIDENGSGKSALNGVMGTDEEAKQRLGRHTRHFHGENLNSGRIPAKLRKLDRESMTKLHKLTGDGIKSNTVNSADGSYKCQFCDKSFPRLGYLKKHEQSHAEHLPFKCEYCARLFKHKRSRDRHTKLHTGDRRYRCPHCEAAFSRSDHLKIHMKTHDNQKPFQCTICNRGYNTAAALTSHMQNHKKQAALLAAGCNPSILNYSPRSTGSASSNSSLYKRRYVSTLATDSSPSNIEYPKRSRVQLACQHCNKFEGQTLEQLEAHMKICTEKEVKVNSQDCKSVDKEKAESPTSLLQLNCEYCNMKFTQVQAMFQHMRACHVDRLSSPTSYDYFSRLAASPRQKEKANFVKSEEVKISSKIEQEEQPTDLSQSKRQSVTPTPAQAPGVFFCNQCNAGMPDFDSFREHLKTHITQGLCLVCSHCGLNLRGQLEYERHVLTHYLTTSAEYNCEASCQTSFKKSEDLQKHLMDKHLHILYKCALCSKTFDTKVSVQLHFSREHAVETKLYRCSACMEAFRNELDFNAHVKSRHQSNANGGDGLNSNTLQCMFCHIVCNSELEMHFHLSAHARQFRCPSCPETFHVEFLLDRHMQHQHAGNENYKLNADNNDAAATSLLPQEHSMNTLYMQALLASKTAVPTTANNNNSVLDYNVALAAKLYNPLHVDTNQMLKQHPALVYGFGQHLFDANRSLLDLYAQQQQQQQHYAITPTAKPRQSCNSNESSAEICTPLKESGLSCGICERHDFRTESELNSHRKIAHNMKTGVSLRCAYCSGNYKSRNELEHHMKTCHNSTGKHKCLICDEVFPSPAILAEHRLQHSMIGQSGKCSHCSKTLNDVHAFRTHLAEHNMDSSQLPVQCICCRQSLHSEFEIGLHAKYHTKSSDTPEVVCALCLESIPNANNETKVCEKCCRKHIHLSKYKNRENLERAALENQTTVNAYLENRCNLCKMILPHASKLQEHLVEHTFAGCESRGFICYICSAVFTASSGLLSHMPEHSLSASPYDCKYCGDKFYFRAELDHHLVKHEQQNEESNKRKSSPPSMKTGIEQNWLERPTIKQECIETEKSTAADDDEYIEVDNVAEQQQAAEKECGEQRKIDS